MGVQETKIDKLNVFHKITKQHAGTLELNETKASTGAVSTTWSWLGGPLGPDSGVCEWDKEKPALVLISQRFSRPRMLSNPAWTTRPPRRPWFKWTDNLELVDFEFKRSNPPVDPNFLWDCKLIMAAKS